MLMASVSYLSGLLQYPFRSMRTVPNQTTIILALVLALLIGGAGVAHSDDDDDDDDHDHELALRALEDGHARPLAEILELARGRLGGEVVGVEFKRENARYVYEFKIITGSGKLREVYVDAATAEVLKSEDDD